jgi:hypothetical protein
MMASSPFIRQYRSAVYLNNAATTFLARGDFLEACLTSRECLSLIESIVRPTETSENATDENSDHSTFQESVVNIDLDLSKKIQHVDKRLAAIQTQTTKSILPLEILCYDGSLDSRRTLLEQQNKECWNFKEIAIPIWISDVIVDEIDDINELHLNVTEIVPAIMLLNYGISHLCYYKYSECESALAGSLRLFHMSMKVLFIHDERSNSTNADNSNDLRFTEGRLFVAMAILSNMKCIVALSENLSFVSRHTGSCRVFTSISQPSSISLSHEILDDLAMLQKVSDEWIAFSTSTYIESLYCLSNAGAA